MALRLKKQQDSPPGTIVSSVKSMLMDPQATFMPGERWLLCDGSTLSTTTNPEYTALWNIIGTKYGGTGPDDFKLPALCVTSVSAGSLPAEDTARVLRGSSDYNTFVNSTAGTADETTSRNNIASGSLTSSSDSLAGQFVTQVVNNVNTPSFSGAPGVQVNRNFANTQLTRRHIPPHNHQTQTIARNRTNSGGWVQSTDGGQQRARTAWRTWFWGETANNDGSNQAHTHRAQITPNSVSGTTNVTFNYSATATHDLTAQFNGSPSDTSIVNKRTEVLYYIKY